MHRIIEEHCESALFNDTIYHMSYGKHKEGPNMLSFNSQTLSMQSHLVLNGSARGVWNRCDLSVSFETVIVV